MRRAEKERASEAARLIRSAAAMLPPERRATASALRALAASVVAGDRASVVFLDLWTARARLGDAVKEAAARALVAGELDAL